MLVDIKRPEYAQPLPDWVETLRPQQVDAVQEIVECFNDGVNVVVLDAPVGSGKTLIGELVPRELGIDKRLYVCSDKSLQDQVLRDFPYARVLKGKNNYIPDNARGSITCDDCTATRPGGVCRWCEEYVLCPYRVAREAAVRASMAVLNTSFFLHASNYVELFSGNPFVVADECDLLEDGLMRFVEYEVPGWIDRKVKVQRPKKGVRKTTLVRWLRDFADDVSAWNADYRGTLEPKQQRSLDAFYRETLAVAEMLQRDIDLGRRETGVEPDDDSGHWLRDYDTATLKLRPVTVAPYGVKRLWRHGKRWLVMSGTVVSAQELTDSLGLPFEYRVVTVPSTFPIENRPVILAPVANIIRSTGESEWRKLAHAISKICERHSGRVLVHTVSYRLAHWLYDNTDTGDRRKFTHSDSREKGKALAAYLDTPESVLFSPSMNRGVDLAGDRCRVQVICKTPFPNLGDRQVSARLRLPGGQVWYAVKTVRDIVQMTGRGVRSETDHCVTYILDEQFTRNIWGRYKGFFLPSFKEAVKTGEDIRWMM